MNLKIQAEISHQKSLPDQNFQLNGKWPKAVYIVGQWKSFYE